MKEGDPYEPIKNKVSDEQREIIEERGFKGIYIEEETGDLIINVINLAKGEQVEVQVLAQGEVFDDTIYGGV